MSTSVIDIFSRFARQTLIVVENLRSLIRMKDYYSKDMKIFANRKNIENIEMIIILKNERLLCNE